MRPSGLGPTQDTLGVAADNSARNKAVVPIGLTRVFDKPNPVRCLALGVAAKGGEHDRWQVAHAFA